MTIKEELEKIFRKIYPTLSFHNVDDFRTQLAPLDASGLITKKTQLEILLVLCQRMQDIEKKIDDIIKVYANAHVQPVTGPDTQEPAQPSV